MTLLQSHCKLWRRALSYPPLHAYHVVPTPTIYLSYCTHWAALGWLCFLGYINGMVSISLCIICYLESFYPEIPTLPVSSLLSLCNGSLLLYAQGVGVKRGMPLVWYLAALLILSTSYNLLVRLHGWDGALWQAMIYACLHFHCMVTVITRGRRPMQALNITIDFVSSNPFPFGWPLVHGFPCTLSHFHCLLTIVILFAVNQRQVSEFYL